MDQRQRRTITPEAVALFARGRAIMEAGDSERWEDDRPPGRRQEFLEIDKRLNIVVLGQDWHCVSVLDDVLDGPMPGYMAHLCAGHDWPTSKALRRALMEALERARGGPDAA
jgi:hypothetical protein